MHAHLTNKIAKTYSELADSKRRIISASTGA